MERERAGSEGEGAQAMDREQKRGTERFSERLMIIIIVMVAVVDTMSHKQ